MSIRRSSNASGSAAPPDALCPWEMTVIRVVTKEKLKLMDADMEIAYRRRSKRTIRFGDRYELTICAREPRGLCRAEILLCVRANDRVNPHGPFGRGRRRDPEARLAAPPTAATFARRIGTHMRTSAAR